MHTRSIITALALSLATTALARDAEAQTGFPYVVSEFTRPYSALTSGAVSFRAIDDGAETVAIGFTFTYFGEQYTHVNIGVNGIMTFAASCDASTRCTQGACNAAGVCAESFLPTGAFGSPAFPRTFNPNRFIAPFWDDLVLRPNSEIRAQTLGTAPRREFVVEWDAIERLPATTSNATFQIRLEEGTNVVRVHYGTFSSATDRTRFTTAVIGAESPDGNVGLTNQTCASNNSCNFQQLINLNGRVIEIALPDGAELTGEATSPTGGDAGDPLPFSLTVSNIGTNTTTVGFQSRVYISTDATLDRGDRELGVLNFPPLIPGQSSTQNLNVTVPNLPIGVYTVGAIVDTSSVVPEAIETNNFVIAQPRFLIGADLAVGSITAPATGGIGDPLTVTIPVTNAGSAQASVGVDVYLSRDATLDRADIKVGTATSAIPAVPSTPVTVNGTVPSNLASGDWRVLAVVDPGNRVTESDETNNVGAANTVTSFVAADLRPDSVRTDRAIAFRGEQITVTTVIENEGGSSARGFEYEFYLSTNELISRISDPFLGQEGPLTIAAGASQTVTHTLTIPAGLPVNDYYVGVIVNANQRVTETNINDNTRRTPTRIVIRDPAPDFSVAQVQTTPRAAAGERLIVERALFNLGNAAGSTAYNVYLSSTSSFDPMTATLLVTGTASIAVNGEDFGLDVIQLAPTISAGDYFIFYEVDPQNTVDELIETNNVSRSSMSVSIVASQLAILTTELPFATVGVPYEVQLGVAGGAGAYMWTVPAGELPQGLMLDPMTGRLMGTPAQEELSRFTLAVTDGAVSVQREFSVLVSEQSEDLEILTRVLPPAYVGRPYEQSLAVYGGVPPYTWELRGLLPDGMTLSPEGVLRGTPTQVDLRMFPVRVLDTLNQNNDRVMVLKVVRQNQSLQLATDALPDGRIGDPYDATLRVVETTGESPFTYSVLDGSLPDGLTLNADKITGTPTRAGIFDVTIRVTDADSDNDSNRFIIEVGERNGVRFLTTVLPDAEIGSPYVDEEMEPVKLRAISEQGSDGVRFSLINGALPDGVTLGEDGVISGTPGRRGPFDFVVRAEDTAGQRSLRAFGLLVNDPPAPPPPLPTNPSSCRCTTPSDQGLGASALLFGLFAIGRAGRRRRRRYLGMLVSALSVTLVSGVAEAQQGFRITERNEAFVERTTGGMPLTFSSPDDGSATITLPFPFRYFDQDFTQVSVGTNGYVVMGSGNANSLRNQSLPSSIAPNTLIALAWDDLFTNGETWFVDGTAPNRVVTIQYRNTRRLGAPTAQRMLMQLRLFEGRSRFEVHYGGIQTQGGFWSFSSGFENQTGTAGTDFFGCGTNCQPTDFPTNRVFLVEADGGTDVLASGISAPLTVFPGSPTTVSFEVSSLHASPLGPFDYGVYLLAGNETQVSGMPLYSSSVVLGGFGSQSQTEVVTVPAGTPLGRYRFALAVDTSNAITEPNETNNILFTDFVRVASPRPDLTVVDINTPSMMVAPGGTLPVNFTIANQGSVAANADWAVVVSRNSVVTADDQVLDSGSIMLGGAETSSISRTVNVPADLPLGSYTVGVVVDPTDTVAEASELNNAVAAMGTVQVAGGNLAITDTTLPPMYLRVPYTTFLGVAGGDGAYTWQLISGTLPRGLAIVTDTGELRGTPIDLGSSTFTVEVRSGMQVATQSFTIDVVEPVGAFSIATRQLLPAVVGADYPAVEAGGMPQRLRTLGQTGTVSFSLDSPAPPGIEFSSDGVFSGVPIQAGRFSVDVRAVDGAGAVATKTLFLTVAEPGRITLLSDALPEGEVGRPFQARLRVIGASPTSTPTFSSMGGSLPPGLVVASTGIIGGTPRQVGSFPFTVTVSESETDPTAQTDTALFRITVRADDSLSFRIDGSLTATVGETVSVELVAVGGTPPFSWLGEGDLPDGFDADVEGPEGNVYEVTGTVTEPGLITFFAQVRDAQQRQYGEAVSFRFLPVPPPPPPPMSTGCAATGSRSGGLLLGLLLIGLAARRRRS